MTDRLDEMKLSRKNGLSMFFRANEASLGMLADSLIILRAVSRSESINALKFLLLSRAGS